MIYCFDRFELDEDLFELRTKGGRIPTQPKALQLLLHLAREHPKAVDKKDVITAVWGNMIVTDAALARVVMEVRKALGDGNQEKLVTVRGRGFRLALDLDVRAPGATHKASGLIGREPCMAALSARFEDAMLGQRRIAIVSGPQGIGKTRVLEELTRMASARGASVLSVRCQAATAGVAHFVWTQLARAHTAQQADPAMQAAVDAIAKSTAPTDSLGVELAEIVTRAFVAASLVRPIVLLIDDLHLADEASLRLLHFFVREASTARILVVGAHRDTPAGEETPSIAMRSLLSDSATLSIPLRGLSIDEVARVVESVAGAPPSGALVPAIHKRSGGNPYYVHQLMKTNWAENALRDKKHGVASSIDLQPGLIESITQHIDAISAETREVLTDAALLGHEFAFDALEAATGVPRADLLDRLDEAVRARLVIKKKNDTFQFAYALVADVLAKSLPSAARTMRHGAIAARLLAHYGDDAGLHAVELAHHCVRALPGADPEHAIAFSILAAKKYALVGANDAAAKNWVNAAHALGYLRGYDARRSVVQIELARARGRAGDSSGALEACLDGVLLARAFRKPEALAEAALLYVELGPADDPRREMVLGEARAALDELPAAQASSLRQKLSAIARSPS